MQHSLTIAMVTYNRKNYLMEALKAIQAQTYKDFQVIILDNASTDGTESIAKEFLADGRFRYIRHPINLGSIGNHNFAVSHCDTDFMIITHDDDRMRPDMIGAEMDVLLNHQDVHLVCCENDYIDESGRIVNQDVLNSLFKLGDLYFQKKHEFILGYVRGLNYVSCPTVIMRMSAVRTANLRFREDAGPATDTLLWMELNCLPGRFAFLGKSLFEYRIHPEQDSARHLLPTYIGLRETVGDLLNRESLESQLSPWQKRIDGNIASMIVQIARSTKGLNREDARALKAKILNRGKAHLSMKWALFWACHYPGFFKLMGVFHSVLVLSQKARNRLSKLLRRVSVVKPPAKR